MRVQKELGDDGAVAVVRVHVDDVRSWFSESLGRLHAEECLDGNELSGEGRARLTKALQRPPHSCPTWLDSAEHYRDGDWFVFWVAP